MAAEFTALKADADLTGPQTDLTIAALDPLQDARWPEFLNRHPAASAFHNPEWLAALRRTYGYKPIALAITDRNGQITDALVCCLVHSWLTGRRLVSLPFSDHCALLVSSREAETKLLWSAVGLARRERCAYFEMRPGPELPFQPATALRFQPTDQFWFHKLDLRPYTAAELFRKLHHNCIQRKVSRAEREGLRYLKGHSADLLNDFYRLMALTRRRHRIPPQPFAWFKNLSRHMGERFTIRIAARGDHAVAAIVTLTYKDTVMYKYACSDESLNNLGGMPFLVWNVIREAKEEGFAKLDLGRCELDNPGLRTFKERLAATRTTLTYWRYQHGASPNFCTPRSVRSAGVVFSHLPIPLLTACGKLLYRHIG